MGCGTSLDKAAEPLELPLPPEEAPPNDNVPPPTITEASPVGGDFAKAAHSRLRKLQELDAATKVPFILIEITGEGPGKGEIEVCGKDEYGVHDALNHFFMEEWGCEKLDPGSLDDDTKIPFCALQFLWPGYEIIEEDGSNNLGRHVMKLIDFMCGKLSWTLAVVNSGNVGEANEVREMQIIFKAPHPMNLVAPHLLIELRSAGYIEVCGDLEEEDQHVFDTLEEYFAERFEAERLEDDAHGNFCDRYYKTGDGIFKGQSGDADSNFGLLATLVCDKVVMIPGWSLVAASCGSVGAMGEHSEQQLIFRRDAHPLGDSPYVMVVLNSKGNIEVNGRECRDVLRKLRRWFHARWSCQDAGFFKEEDMACSRFNWPVEDLDFMRANADIMIFFERQGFELQVSTQYMIKEDGENCREQQLFFRPGKTEVGTVEPHLILELYTGEGSPELYADPEEPTQALANQLLRIQAVSERTGEGKVECQKAREIIAEFVLDYLGGSKESENTFGLSIFMCRGWYENNLAQWTMRLCDFMVDRLGWSFLICSLCNMGEHGQFRTQQLIFRYDGDKRDMPVSNVIFGNKDPELWADTPFPDYWQGQDLSNRVNLHKTINCSSEEIEALQQMCDATFKRVLTRDRAPDDDAVDDEEMPFRLEVLHAFRSEHAYLYHRFWEAATQKPTPEEPYFIKTSEPGTVLTERLTEGSSYLFHGTNPSSAMSILKTGFQLRHAGSTTGTMYGPGVYMAEASSKSDEYGCDDGGNTYPGLRALLVCRCYVGTPLVVNGPGDHVSAARDAGLDCVCGDRESTVGTYRELVFFNEAQVYPEYTIIYRRNYDKTKVPEEMVQPTKGSTGRFWQYRGDFFGFRGWKNVPVEINNMLIGLAKTGSAESITVWLGELELHWNVSTKTVMNSDGASCPLRAPYNKAA
eukprot:TRINITY_DN2008_c0_g2_i1.p1 TRINITY_DN2008_c0_g2~~TRINITY_DN2008_c0_g2_i1.p1  ORF type:complete len:919 (+),score=270.97 TRINITY_DN2008_c0_g2_i1:52-2808(+)